MPTMPETRHSVLSGKGAHGQALMLFDDSRFFYRGLLPEATQRCGGGWTITVAVDRPMQVKVGVGPWVEARMFATTPYQVHSIRGQGGIVAQFHVEAEGVNRAHLPQWLADAQGPITDAKLLAHWIHECARLDDADVGPPLAEHLDRLFFGSPLLQRALDSRVAQVIDRITAQPGQRHSAEESADAASLSVSRFLHLFTQELGVPYRRFRAWKRARALMQLVPTACNLTEMALESGYADSAHFSNSIRGTYGVKPKDILAATRRMLTFRHCPAMV